MSEMVRADHFDLDVRPAVASTERVMATAFPALWRRSAACGNGPDLVRSLAQYGQHGSCCLIRRRTEPRSSCLRRGYGWYTNGQLK